MTLPCFPPPPPLTQQHHPHFPLLSVSMLGKIAFILLGVELGWVFARLSFPFWSMCHYVVYTLLQRLLCLTLPQWQLQTRPLPQRKPPLPILTPPFGVAEIFFNLWGSVLLPSSHAASRPSSCLVIVCLILYAGYPSVFLPLSCCHRNASNNNSTIKCGRGQRLPATTAHLPKTPNHLFIALPSMFMPLTTKEIKLPTLKFNCIFLPEPHSKFLKATVVVESGKVRGMTTT